MEIFFKKNHRFDLFETSKILLSSKQPDKQKIPPRDILDKYVPFFNWHTVKSQAVDCLVY